MYYFRHPEFFFSLLVVPLLLIMFLILVRWKRKAGKKIGDPKLVAWLTRIYSPRLFTLKFLLVTSSVICCGFAAADLVSPEGQEIVNRKGIDVMIALDVSKSMLAEDIKPSRLERAKQALSKIIDKLDDDRIGIVIFAGKAYLQMPMTADHSAAKMYLSAASTEDVPTQGTVISQALKMCYAAFNTKEKKYRSILLITDGEDHDEDAIKVTKQLAEEGVMVNTIGIGSPQGAPIMDKEINDYKKDENGNTVISKLNEQELKEIAYEGKGIYQLFTNSDEVAANIKNKLSSIGETTITDTSFVNYKTYFFYFLIASLVLLLIEFFMPEKRSRFVEALGLLLLMFFPGTTYSQTVTPSIKSGNEAYKKQRYPESAAIYGKVASKEPANTTATYNLGNALYKSDKPEEAAGEYDKTIAASKDKNIKSKSYYNKGVAYQKQKKLPECIEAYKNCLKISPDDEEARQNLERALKQMKDKQKQNKQDQQQKKQDQKPDKQKQDNQPKEQQSKISKQDAEEKLKSLLDHEKDLQDKLHKVRGSGIDKPKKDW